MLTGTELGAAIERARLAKRVTKKAMAAHFGVTPPSIQDWVRRGTIDKERLPGLWSYFSDVVGPAHWGLVRFPTGPAQPEPVVPVAAREPDKPYHTKGASRSLSVALDVLGAELRRIPIELREAVATNLAGWAREGGAPHYKPAIMAILDSEPEKRSPRAA